MFVAVHVDLEHGVGVTGREHHVVARQDHVQRLGTVAVLAVVGSALPTAMRTFLLTLAVVDDLIALIIIAFVYTDSVRVLFLGGAAVLLGILWVLTHKYAN